MINFVNNAPFAGGGDIAYINNTIDSQKNLLFWDSSQNMQY